MNANPCGARLREGDSVAAELLRAYPTPSRLDASRVVAIRERLLVRARRNQRRKSTLAVVASACALAVVIASYVRLSIEPERAIVVAPDLGGVTAGSDWPEGTKRDSSVSVDAPELQSQDRKMPTLGIQPVGSADGHPVSRRGASRGASSAGAEDPGRVPVRDAPSTSSVQPPETTEREHESASSPLSAPRASLGTEPSNLPPPETVTAPGKPQNASFGSPETTRLERESSMLGEALVALRRERSPSKALARLDAYDAAFPRGSLRGEASVARVDALLALNRNAEALSQLQRLPIMSLPRGNELRVVRAELSARQGYCDAAIADANATLTQTPNGALAARAKRVLANCAAQ